MLKFEKESSINNVKCDNKWNEENTVKQSQYSLQKAIGHLNVKRWNALKSVLNYKNDEDFATKLLDEAEEYYRRQIAINNDSSNNVKKDIKRSKTKTKSVKNKHEEKEKPRKDEITVIKLEENHFPETETTFKNEAYDTEGTYNTPSKKPSECILRKHDYPVFEVKSAIQNQLEQKIGKKLLQCDDGKVVETNKNTNSNGKENDKSRNNLNITNVNTCQNCSTSHIKDRCPINYPHYIIKDSMDHKSWLQKYKPTGETNETELQNDKNSEIDKDLDNPNYSMMSIPSFLTLGETNTSHGLGVFTKKSIEPFSQFGPLMGQIVKEVDISEDFNMKYLWEISSESGNTYVNSESDELSNWLKYIRPAPKREDRNLTVISKEKKLYFVTIRFIKSGEELFYWQDNPISASKKKMEKTTCGGCNMVFTHPQYYRIHCSVFHDLRYSLTIRKYHCKICGAAVLGKENIMKHAAELHNGQGAYQCQFCKKFFLRLNYLEMHRTYGCSANPHRSRPLCDFCGRKFCQPQKLKVHIKRMHSDFSEVLKEFQCKICLKILGSRAALQRHSKEVHQKQIDGACSCSRCGKKFQNKSNLKIHMLTHSGIKPFKCSADNCKAAFTTKQCLQFHYKKVHNFTEENMPKINRSVDYTFQAYSGVGMKEEQDNENTNSKLNESENGSDSDNESMESQSSNMDDPPPLKKSPHTTEEQPTTPNPPPSPMDNYNFNTLNTSMKVLSKGSKKWIAGEPPHTDKPPDIYPIEKLNKDELPNISLQETDIYSRSKLNNLGDFSRHEASNASLLVEAALDSVCSEPNIDIDVNTTPNCTDSLVNNLYTLTQPENLPDVSYGDTACLSESRDINLMSPSVNDHVSVTDELNNELHHANNIRMDYSNFHQQDFSPPNSPEVSRSNFVRNYINNLSPHNPTYEQKNVTPVPSPPRYDFGHAVNADHLSSDDSNGMAAQNLSLHNPKNNVQLDLSLYKTSYKLDSQNYMRRLKFESETNALNQDQLNMLNQNDLSGMQPPDVEHKESEQMERSKYPDDISPVDIRNKFDIDLDLRLKNYENIDNEILRQRNGSYENGEDFRIKGYDLMDAIENRNKQYENMESDFRTDRNFEPLLLNSSELQGLDMSARSFHSYSNINRYHHLYPEVDRVDLRLNYSPPLPTYTHADILRVVSLDLTPPGRHSVDLSLRSHPLHQIANSRLLTEHGLQSTPHRLLDQSRLLSADLTSSRHLTNDGRLITEASSRILSEHTASRILSSNEQLSTNHLLTSEQNRLISDDARIISDQSRILEQGRLLREGRILPPTTPSGAVSPVQGFAGYSVTQTPYHPTPIAPRPHVSSPTPTPYHHYSSYY